METTLNAATIEALAALISEAYPRLPEIDCEELARSCQPAYSAYRPDDNVYRIGKATYLPDWRQYYGLLISLTPLEA